MGARKVVLHAFLCIQLGFAFGQSTTATVTTATTNSTYGTIVAEDFIKNLASVEENLYKGIAAVADPLMKIALETAPDVAHIYALLNGVSISPSMAALGKEIFGKVALAGGKTLGGAAVLGSSLLKNVMEVGAHGIQAGSNILQAKGEAGINLFGKLADHAINATGIGANITSGGLTAVGDGFSAASTGVTVVSEGISELVTAIGNKLTQTITLAQDTLAALKEKATQLANGTYQFENTQQQQLYNALYSFVNVLKTIQTLVGNVSSITSIAG